MNKWQIICPLAAVVLFLLLAAAPRAVSRYKMHRMDSITTAVRCVGWDLEQQTNSTWLAVVTPELKKTLENFLTTPSCYIETLRFGDASASARDRAAIYDLYIKNFDDACMSLKLKYDSKLKKFHVLGFQHPAIWPDPAV
jgi:hypothetical protein